LLATTKGLLVQNPRHEKLDVARLEVHSLQRNRGVDPEVRPTRIRMERIRSEEHGAG
jgi:hypothetical protein